MRILSVAASASLLVLATLSFLPTAHSDKTDGEPERSLADVVEYLRYGDYRLVRPSPSDSTSERQHSLACQADLERAYKVLLTSTEDPDSSKELVDAAQVVSLCTTNNPKNRAKLTTTQPDSIYSSVPEALVAMLKRKNDPAAVAAAAECIWISSFNNVDNYNALVEAGAVEALANVLTSVEPCQHKSCHHADMWSAAALQNLAATYCQQNHGYCDYEWVSKEQGQESDGEDVAYKVVLSENATPTGDPTPVRQALLTNKLLMDTLDKTICAHVNEVEEHPNDRTWPSRAHATDDIHSPHIVPWAMLGLVKNLALDDGSFSYFSEQVVDCICDYAVQSPDWLEYSKAQDALWNFGWDYELFCEPMYHDDECEDFDGFEDEEGNNCFAYEEERWCAEFGAVENSEGVTAHEACCVCGGGHDVEDEL